jgi:hypothetical protein
MDLPHSLAHLHFSINGETYIFFQEVTDLTNGGCHCAVDEDDCGCKKCDEKYGRKSI